MAIEKKEINFAKETDDVMGFVVELIKVIREKGDYTSLVDELVKAVQGVEDIDNEWNDDLFTGIDTVLLRATEITKIFVK